MDIEQLSKEYNIEIAVLKKMEEDSKAGTKFRKLNKVFSRTRSIEVVFKDGKLSTQIKGFPPANLVYPPKEEIEKIFQ